MSQRKTQELPFQVTVPLCIVTDVTLNVPLTVNDVPANTVFEAMTVALMEPVPSNVRIEPE